MRKTGNIFYEDSRSYTFPVDHSDKGGSSGSPVLDEQGEVVGVASSGIYNLQGTIKVNYLVELIRGSIGMECFKSEMRMDLAKYLPDYELLT